MSFPANGREAPKASWFAREGAPVRGILDLDRDELERTLDEHLERLAQEDEEIDSWR